MVTLLWLLRSMMTRVLVSQSNPSLISTTNEAYSAHSGAPLLYGITPVSI
jgi:hypothetical protein